MKSASPSSKSKPVSAKDDAEINGSLGYVSCSEIRNLFTERIRQLDTEIWPRNRTPYRDEILDFYVTTMIDLMQKAQRNYEQFCRRQVIPSRPSAAVDTTQSQKAYEERLQRLEKYQKT